MVGILGISSGVRELREICTPQQLAKDTVAVAIKLALDIHTF
jgi:hypothetical protein